MAQFVDGKRIRSKAPIKTGVAVVTRPGVIGGPVVISSHDAIQNSEPEKAGLMWGDYIPVSRTMPFYMVRDLNS